MPEEDIEIVIRLRDLQSFIAGTEEARIAIHKIGTETQQVTEISSASIGKVEGVVGRIKSAANSAVTSLSNMAHKAHTSVSNTMDKIHATAKKPILGEGMVGELAGFAVAGLSVEGVKKAVETTTELAKTAQTFHTVTGMSQKDAAAWSALTQAYGVNQRSFGLALKSIATQTNALLTGGKSGKAARQMFKELGVSTDEVKRSSHNMNEELGVVVDHFNKMPGGAQKTALATKLFGRSWQQLLPMFAEGSKGMEEQRKTAEGLGITLGGNATKNAMKMHEAQIQLKLATMGLQVAFANQLAPTLFKVLGVLVKLLGIVLKNMQPAFKLLGQIIHDVTVYLKSHHTEWIILRDILIYMAAVFVALKVQIIAARIVTMLFGKEAILTRSIMIAWRVVVIAVRTAMLLLRAAIWVVNAALAGNPIGIVIVALTALVAVTILVITHWKEVKKVTMDVFNTIKNFVIGVVNTVVGFVKKNWPLLVLLFAGPFGPIILAFTKFRSTTIGIFTDIWNFIKSIPGKIASVFSSIGQTLIAPFQTAFNWISSHMPKISTVHVGPISLPKISFGAAGGIVPTNQPVLVGEKGPELLHLARGTQVTPLPRAGMQAVTSNASMPPLVVSVQIQRKEIANAVAKFNNDQLARK